MKTILLVDNNEDNLTTLKRLLRPYSYSILTASSGVNALETLAQREIQLVITNQNMSHMKGTELVTHIKQLYPNILSIILSEYSDFDEVSQTLYNGELFNFISKPWHDDTVCNAVAAAFSLYEVILQQPHTNDDDTNHAILLIDIDGNITSSNIPFTACFDYEEEDLINKNIDFFIDSNVTLLEQNDWHGKIELTSKHQEKLFVWMSILPIWHNDEICMYQYLFFNLTKQDLLGDERNKDRLTGLPNRDAFKTRLGTSIKNAKLNDERVCLILIGMHQFKNINAALGEKSGDEILQTVSERISLWTRHNEMVARVSGDEFGVLIQYDSKSIVLDYYLAELHHQITAPYYINDQEVFMNINIGISLYPDLVNDEASLMQTAMIALNESKLFPEQHYYRFDPSKTKDQKNDFSLENDLHKALEKDEIILYFQPQYSTEDNSIVGGETLLRWNHTKHGLIAPNQFIPSAENNGLIIPIERWAMMKSCLLAQSWREKYNKNFHISLNLSVKEFIYPGLVEYIRGMLYDTDFSAEHLILEVTETALMQNMQKCYETLIRLKDLGAKIALDDFGKGFSSLNYLLNIPFDIVKIDYEFTQKILTDERALTIIEAILFIADKLNMRVITEGIETEVQLDMIKKLGCKEVQGFYFSKPVPEKDFEKLLMP